MNIHERPALTAADRTVLGVALVLPTVITWIYFILLHGAPAAQQQCAYGIGKTIQFALPIIWVLLVQRERPWFRPPSSWSLIVGVLFGLAVAAAMVAIYHFAPQLFDIPAAAVRQKVKSFGADSPIAFLLLAVFYSVIHSLLEEYYWRWFVFGQLARDCRHATANIISSIAFVAHHVLVLGHYFGYSGPLSALTWLFTLAIVIGGAFWAWLYHKSDSLAAPWLSHALIDAAIFAIGYQMIVA